MENDIIYKVTLINTMVKEKMVQENVFNENDIKDQITRQLVEGQEMLLTYLSNGNEFYLHRGLFLVKPILGV